MGPVRGGVGGSWVLLFHKELVPNQIMSLRTLQKASYFTRGKSLSFNNSYEPCRIWGDPIRTPSTSHGLSPTGSMPILAVLQHSRGAPASGSSQVLFPLMRMLFSQILIRVVCSLTSFCPYSNVTISVMPSPDATPKINKQSTHLPLPHTLPLLVSKPALVFSWTYDAI